MKQTLLAAIMFACVACMAQADTVKLGGDLDNIKLDSVMIERIFSEYQPTEKYVRVYQSKDEFCGFEIEIYDYEQDFYVFTNVCDLIDKLKNCK